MKILILFLALSLMSTVSFSCKEAPFLNDNCQKTINQVLAMPRDTSLMYHWIYISGKKDLANYGDTLVIAFYNNGKWAQLRTADTTYPPNLRATIQSLDANGATDYFGVTQIGILSSPNCDDAGINTYVQQDKYIVKKDTLILYFSAIPITAAKYSKTPKK